VWGKRLNVREFLMNGIRGKILLLGTMPTSSMSLLMEIHLLLFARKFRDGQTMK